MKLRIYFKPEVAVLSLAAAAAMPCLLALALDDSARIVFLAIALLYALLFCIAGWALWRCYLLERRMEWPTARRLLVLAPHEDDCVIAAGGVGARNVRLGGPTRIVYLAPDEAPGMAEVRAREARAAWHEAGLDATNLHHLNLLPPLRTASPDLLRTAASTLRTIVDEFKPDVVIVPMFEGGHVHHDMVSGLMGVIAKPDDKFEVFEAPEYSPYVSLLNTPHRVITLCTRWLFGLVAYYGPADGIDGRPLFSVRLDDQDLALKRRMLAAFVSQNAPSLVATRAYPDRLVRRELGPSKRHPFNVKWSYLNVALGVRRFLPDRLVDRLLPVQRGTIGRENGITDWHREWTTG